MTQQILALSAVVGVLPLLMTAPAPAPAKPKTEFERRWESVTNNGKRVNGARLTAKVKEYTAEKLVLEWSIDYDGPRSPLVIITPTYEEGRTLMPLTAGIEFFAEGSDGNLVMQYHVNVPRTLDGMIYSTAQYKPKEFYLTVPKGKPVTGTAEAPFARVVANFKHANPKTMVQAPRNMLCAVLPQTGLSWQSPRSRRLDWGPIHRTCPARADGLVTIEGN